MINPGIFVINNRALNKQPGKYEQDNKVSKFMPIKTKSTKKGNIWRFNARAKVIKPMKKLQTQYTNGIDFAENVPHGKV